MNRELDQTLQRNLERLYNYLENPEREEAQRVLLAAEPEPIRITHGIPDLYTDWLSSPSYSAQGGLTGQLTQVISQTAGRPVLSSTTTSRFMRSLFVRSPKPEEPTVFR